MKYTLDDLRFYEELTSSDSTVDYDERGDKLIERFGTENISMGEILEGLDEKYTYIVGGEFESPGYDMTGYVVAWLEDGKIQQERFIEETY